MAFDYLSGAKTMKEIAAAEQLSYQRVTQILAKVARQFGLTCMSHAKHDPTKYLNYLRALDTRKYIPLGPAETPEEFFYEMLAEPRVSNYDSRT